MIKRGLPTSPAALSKHLSLGRRSSRPQPSVPKIGLGIKGLGFGAYGFKIRSLGFRFGV